MYLLWSSTWFFINNRTSTNQQTGFNKKLSMFLLAVGFSLLAITTSLLCDVGSCRGTSVQDAQDMYKIIRKFELCNLKCKGKYCECCQKVNEIYNVEVCGTSLVSEVEKTVDVSLKVAGQNLVSTKVNLDRLVNFCGTIKSKAGSLNICVDASLNDSKANPDAFSVCTKVDLALEGVKYLQITFNCVQVAGDILIEGKTENGYKTLGAVKILNGDQLANKIKNAIFGKK